MREVRDAGSRRRRAYNWRPREFQRENRTLSLYKATPNRSALLGFGAISEGASRPEVVAQAWLPLAAESRTPRMSSGAPVRISRGAWRGVRLAWPALII